MAIVTLGEGAADAAGARGVVLAGSVVRRAGHRPLDVGRVQPRLGAHSHAAGGVSEVCERSRVLEESLSLVSAPSH